MRQGWMLTIFACTLTVQAQSKPESRGNMHSYLQEIL
jgi:hypothetical protein